MIISLDVTWTGYIKNLYYNNVENQKTVRHDNDVKAIFHSFHELFQKQIGLQYRSLNNKHPI